MPVVAASPASIVGLLGVGPVSAGATPGPACYGKGGTEPTVTDANLLLGYISPEGLLGGHSSSLAELAARPFSVRWRSLWA